MKTLILILSLLCSPTVFAEEAAKAPTAEDTHPVPEVPVKPVVPDVKPAIPPAPEGPFTAFRVGYALKEGKEPVEKCVGFEVEAGSEAQAKKIREQKYIKDFGAMFCLTLTHVCKKCEPLSVKVIEKKK